MSNPLTKHERHTGALLAQTGLKPLSDPSNQSEVETWTTKYATQGECGSPSRSNKKMKKWKQLCSNGSQTVSQPRLHNSRLKMQRFAPCNRWEDMKWLAELFATISSYWCAVFSALESKEGLKLWPQYCWHISGEFIRPLAGMCSDDSAPRFEGDTFLSSSNKAEMSKAEMVRMVRRHAGSKVASERKILVATRCAL